MLSRCRMSEFIPFKNCYKAGLPVYHGLSNDQRASLFHMMLHLDASKCINDEIMSQIFDEFTGMDRALDLGGPVSATRTEKFNALVRQ